jgi:pyridoxal phosphate enzyme (YggS family)
LSSLAERLAEVRQRIEAAATQVGRSTSEIELIVVTKNHPAQLAMNLYELGVRDFGENRDQEAAPKAAELQRMLYQRPDAHSPNWHFVGQLQSNKVKSILSYTAVLHALDRISLLHELRKQLERLNRNLDCFVQMNLTDDVNRGGVQPENLLQFAEEVIQSDRINLLGIMAVADPRESPKAEFAKVLDARQKLLTVAPNAGKLSIGMSGDFEEAIRQGATHLRIGSAITQSAESSA